MMLHGIRLKSTWNEFVAGLRSTHIDHRKPHVMCLCAHSMGVPIGVHLISMKQVNVDVLRIGL